MSPKSMSMGSNNASEGAEYQTKVRKMRRWIEGLGSVAHQNDGKPVAAGSVILSQSFPVPAAVSAGAVAGMTAKPEGKMGGMAEAEGMGDFLERSVGGGELLARGVGAPPLELCGRGDLQFLSEELFQAAPADRQVSEQFIAIERVSERPRVEAREHRLHPCIVNDSAGGGRDVQRCERIDKHDEPFLERRCPRCVIAQRKRWRLRGFAVADRIPTVHSVEQVARGSVERF
jgi:hypothetical protein